VSEPLCLAWLKAVRATALAEGRRTDRGAAVLGDGFGGYTVEFPDASQVYVGRVCCKYCARAEAIINSTT
jgi:hypothetical protein